MATKDFFIKNGIITGVNTATIGSAFYVVSNGNIGIGNSSPSYTLTINGNLSSGNNNISGWVNASSGFYGTVQTATQATINHNSLANYSANQHVDHTSVSISTANGVTGGGDISSTRTISVVAGTGTVVNTTGVHVNSTYIGTISANNTTYVNGKTEGNLNVNNATTFSSTAQNSQFNSIGVGTAATGTIGEIRATSDVTAYYSSDISLKEKITKIENALEKLFKINGYKYDWKDDYINSRGGEDGYFIRKHDVGVIAQEIEQVLPEIVSEREDGIKAVKYERIVALLIEAVKELSEKVDILENRVK